MTNTNLSVIICKFINIMVHCIVNVYMIFIVMISSMFIVFSQYGYKKQYKNYKKTGRLF